MSPMPLFLTGKDKLEITNFLHQNASQSSN